jgi:hypothetical protein
MSPFSKIYTYCHHFTFRYALFCVHRIVFGVWDIVFGMYNDITRTKNLCFQQLQLFALGLNLMKHNELCDQSTIDS